MKVISLLDITETNQYKHRSNDSEMVHQQSNFMTMLQTLGMRHNIYYTKSPTVETVDVEDYGFSDKYKGKHKVWTFEFEVDSATSVFDTEATRQDFDLIPMISGLQETIQINNNVFRTTGGETNIIFKA